MTETVEWPSFWENFKSLIDSNENFSDVDKFSYLKVSVHGLAASTTSSLTLSDLNYSVATSLLQERFGDPQKIISDHMDAQVNLPSVASSKVPKLLRQLCDSIEALERTYGELFFPSLLNKIPKDVCLIIRGKVPWHSWSLKSILKEFKDDLNNRERCEYTVVSVSSGRDERKPEYPGKRSIRGPSTASALVVASYHTQTPSCVYYYFLVYLISLCIDKTQREDVFFYFF